MWLAALSGRLAYVGHVVRGHAVAWRTAPGAAAPAAGDIGCVDCGRLLWLRAHDPWRAAPAAGGGEPGEAEASTFDGFQQVLRLATQCPPGLAGDDIRRAACELIEADTEAGRETRRRRLMLTIASVEWRRANGLVRGDDPEASTLRRLADVLTRHHASDFAYREVTR